MPPYPTLEELKSQLSGPDRIRAGRIIAELKRRKLESIRMYEPMQHFERFHASRAPERIARGSNRSGKTLCGAMELARAVCGLDPHNKYPKRNGRAFVVGKDGKHISEVLYRKLFRPGAFSMVKLNSGRWRAYRPWQRADKQGAYGKPKPAPPLIPPRLIESIGWESKKEQVPNVVRLKNGWEIRFFSSLGAPPQGSDIDLCLAGWCEVYDPVEGRHRRIDEIREGWHVLSEKDGAVVVRRASQPFIKSFGEIVRATLSNGEVLFTTRRHRVLSEAGEWVSMQAAFDEQVSLRSWEVHGAAGKQTASYRESQVSLPSELLPYLRPSAAVLHQADTSTSAGTNASWESHVAAGSAARWSGTCHTSSLFGPSCTSHTSLASPRHSWHEEPLLWIASDCEDKHGLSDQLPEDYLGDYCSCLHRDDVRLHSATDSDRLHVPRPSGAFGRSRPSSQMDAPGDTPASTRPCPGNRGVVRVVSLESCGNSPIWDISVEDTHTYLYGSTVSSNSWFDEEIVNPEWYNEISARLIDRSGLFFWTATAQLGGIQFYELSEEASRLQHEPDPRVIEVFAHIESNPYFTDDQRKVFYSKLTDEQIRIRVEGEFAFTSYRIYPEFDMHKLGIDYFEIPNDWTRYVSIDPGRQVCAILFAALPPPSSEYHGHVVFYDEMYLKNCSAAMFGEEMRKRCAGQNFWSFFIDHCGSRITEVGSGYTVERQYSDALKKVGVESETTGHGFIWGNQDIAAGIEKLRDWLLPKENGKPKLLVFRDKLPNLQWEMARYHYKRVKGQITDKPEDRYNHLCDAARYIAMHEPTWHKKPARHTTSGLIWEMIRKRRAKEIKKNGLDALTLGPGR